jgi:hypothetical protein
MFVPTTVYSTVQLTVTSVSCGSALTPMISRGISNAKDQTREVPVSMTLTVVQTQISTETKTLDRWVCVRLPFPSAACVCLHTLTLAQDPHSDSSRNDHRGRETHRDGGGNADRCERLTLFD